MPIEQMKLRLREFKFLFKVKVAKPSFRPRSSDSKVPILATAPQ